jgi:hypothetical protein
VIDDSRLEYEKWVNRVIDHVREHLAEDLSLAALAPGVELALIDEAGQRPQAADGLADVRRLYAVPGFAGPGRVRCLSPTVGPHEVGLDLGD